MKKLPLILALALAGCVHIRTKPVRSPKGSELFPDKRPEKALRAVPVTPQVWRVVPFKMMPGYETNVWTVLRKTNLNSAWIPFMVNVTGPMSTNGDIVVSNKVSVEFYRWIKQNGFYTYK